VEKKGRQGLVREGMEFVNRMVFWPQGGRKKGGGESKVQKTNLGSIIVGQGKEIGGKRLAHAFVKT